MYSNIFHVSVSRYLSIKIYLCMYKYLCTVRPHILIIIIDIFLYLFISISRYLSTEIYTFLSLSLSLDIYIYIYIYCCSLLSSRHTVLHVMCIGTVLILAVAVQCVSHGRPHVDLTMTIPPPC